jgi:hypothetical protein
MGAELDGTVLLSAVDLVSVSVIYEDSKYLDYCVPSAFYTGSGPISTCPNGKPGYNYDQQPFSSVPRWPGNASYEHIFELPNAGAVIPQVMSRFKSRYTAGNTTEVLPSYSNSSATITYRAPRGFRLSV